MKSCAADLRRILISSPLDGLTTSMTTLQAMHIHRNVGLRLPV